MSAILPTLAVTRSDTNIGALHRVMAPFTPHDNTRTGFPAPSRSTSHLSRPIEFLHPTANSSESAGLKFVPFAGHGEERLFSVREAHR